MASGVIRNLEVRLGSEWCLIKECHHQEHDVFSQSVITIRYVATETLRIRIWVFFNPLDFLLHI